MALVRIIVGEKGRVLLKLKELPLCVSHNSFKNTYIISILPLNGRKRFKLHVIEGINRKGNKKSNTLKPFVTC